MAAYARRSFDLSNPGNPEHLEGGEVSSSFVNTLGIGLALGREFSPEENRNGGAPVSIISNALWRDRFGGCATALGKSMVLNGVESTVVGVPQPGFRFGTDYADVYIPIGQRKLVNANDRTAHDVMCVARLKPGVSLSQASKIRITEERKTRFMGTSTPQEIEDRPGHFLYFLRDATTGYRRYEYRGGYCGYCLTLVTRVPVKRTNTVFDGGWP